MEGTAEVGRDTGVREIPSGSLRPLQTVQVRGLQSPALLPQTPEFLRTTVARVAGPTVGILLPRSTPSLIRGPCQRTVVRVLGALHGPPSSSRTRPPSYAPSGAHPVTLDPSSGSSR